MSDDTISPETLNAYCRIVIETIGDGPIPRYAAALFTVDAPPWVTTQEALAEHFARSGCHAVAKRLRRLIVPAGHIAVVLAKSDLRMRVIDLEGDDAAEPTEARADPSPVHAPLMRPTWR